MDLLSWAKNFALQAPKSNNRGQTFAKLGSDNEKYTIGPFLAPFEASSWDKRLSLDFDIGNAADELNAKLEELTRPLGGEFKPIAKTSSNGTRLRLKLDDQTKVWDHDKKSIGMELPEAIPIGSWASAVVRPYAWALSGRRGVTFHCEHVMLSKRPDEVCPF